MNELRCNRSQDTPNLSRILVRASGWEKQSEMAYPCNSMSARRHEIGPFKQLINSPSPQNEMVGWLNVISTSTRRGESNLTTSPSKTPTVPRNLKCVKAGRLIRCTKGGGGMGM